jgi:hypothetical protein
MAEVASDKCLPINTLTVDGIAETLHTALSMNETTREALISSAKEWSKRFMHDPGADFALVLERLRKA